MRLKSVKDTPMGGWRFPVLDGEPPVRAESYRSLIREVKRTLANNNKPLPSDLEDQIQDYICSQSAPDKCFYTAGLGDRISQGIHAGLEIVDKVAGTQLARKARGCGGCGKRRQTLNKLS